MQNAFILFIIYVGDIDLHISTNFFLRPRLIILNQVFVTVLYYADSILIRGHTWLLSALSKMGEVKC